jgi:hypothetical protein
MHVPALDPVTATAKTSRSRERGAEVSVGPASDWIDPEGGDWIAAIYREPAAGSPPPNGEQPACEVDHWFG